MEPTDDSLYVYLEFNDKIPSSIFANKMFLRVANLHKPEPVVQINDLLFKGSYDECVGTNIFFEEVDNPKVTNNIFDKTRRIHLKPTTAQTKVIKLKQVKLPRENTSDTSLKESVVLNLDQDYNIILERLEQGVLNLEDLAHKDTEYTPDEQRDQAPFGETPQTLSESEREIETLLENVEPKPQTSPLDIKYEKLKRLARRPVRRMKSPERVQECEPQFRNAFEYHNLERQVCQSSDYFRSVSCPIVEKSFVGGVDIDRCILQGLLPAAADVNYVLTKDEQKRILNVDNFENLSIPARYLVLKECVSQIEDLIESTSGEELKECDENGRTIVDICATFRRLVRALEVTMGGEDGDGDGGGGAKTRIDDVEYVKYKYQGDDFVDDMFDSDEWTTDEETNKDKSGSVVESDEGEDRNEDEKMEIQSGEESGDSLNDDSDRSTDSS